MKNKDDYEIKKQKCRKQKSNAKTGIANFKDKLALAIKSATIEGIVDGITLAKKLQMIKNKSKYLNIRAWPQESVLPEEIEFEWKKMTSNWASAILIFLDSNHYEKGSERSFLNKLQPFIFYLTVYLPVYFQFNTDSDAVYPRRVDDLVGGYFISIPVTLPDKNLPLPYVEFVKAWHHGNDQYRRYDSIRALHQFFDEILKRKELLGIKAHYANPVMKSGQDNGVDNAYKGSIATDSEGKRITPHATRTIVVSEWCQILPHELVGRHITGKRPETVAYYNQNDADEMKKIRAAQKSHLQKINRDKSKLDLELDPVCIEAADKNAALVKGFNQDAKQAIIDFGGSCSNFFIGDNGLDVVTKRRKIK